MIKKLTSILFSTRLMAILFLTFAVAMIAGTFIESKYNTDTARIWVYNAWWFEGIMLFFMINFIGNIKRYDLLKKEKWATLMLHLAFVFIIAGAFITRYISYEGMMPIREGNTENVFYSDKMYLTISVDGQYQGKLQRRVFEKALLLSPVTNNDFSVSGDFDGKKFEVKYEDFIMGAKETIRPDDKGSLYFKIVEAGDGERHEHFLKEGEVQNIHNVLFSLNKYVEGAINITFKDGEPTIQSPFEGQFMRMADKLQGKLTKDIVQPLMMRSLYSIGDMRVVFPEPATKGTLEWKSSEDYKAKGQNDVLVLKFNAGDEEKKVTLIGTKGRTGEPKTFKIGKLDYTFTYGNKVYTLPFSIKLNDFIAQKYPGTEKSFSSFESQITVRDKTEIYDYKIYMNHILDHDGYRFFQSSFDPDEKGTVLSVNHDYWGTLITYIGYYMLFFAMIAIFFTKNSRFTKLKQKLESVKIKKENLLVVLFFFMSFGAFSQNFTTQFMSEKQVDSILNKRKVSEAHAAKFGRLIIQDAGGRMKPVNTFSSELLRKVSHKDTYNEMNSDQVFMSMTQAGNLWVQVPMIYIKAGNDSIRKIIGIDAKQKYASFLNFFDETGNYKLSPYLESAYKNANPNQFEKDFIETDKKLILMQSALSGNILKIFPIPNDANNKWVSYPELEDADIKGMEGTYTKNILSLYFGALEEASVSNNYQEAEKYLESINNYQKKYGSKVMPSEQKITSEILYNKYDVFKKLPFWYLYAAMVMLFFAILKIFKERKPYDYIINSVHIIIALLFALHTFGLIARWYISGHAPWSNAYESIIYVAWATMLFGLTFDRKSKLTVASSAFVTAMILSAAYMNWIDPEIGNLQPVLNSYWLMIHVAVIVASYGPFALGMILGVVSLLLILFTNEKNRSKMILNIKELTYINEMALTIGLVMLTIGNFLGGQWANESWGRYWGWDPKETWALISIMVYAFVIHARFVPSLRGKWLFNLMSIYAFVSILFTYFGVNFHLVGLHSYASGEAKSLDWIWQTLSAITILGAISYPKYRKYYKKTK